MTLGPVLVATDLSPGSAPAVSRARQIARAAGVPLIICHVIESTEAVEDAGSIRADLAESYPDAEVVVRSGEPYHAILEVASQHKPCLVVVGAFGAHRTNSAVLGVTTDRVLRKAESPVLVTHAARGGPHRVVIVGVDGSAESLGALELAGRIAPEARIVAVRAFNPVGVTKLENAGADPHQIAAFRRATAEHAKGELEGDLGGAEVEMLVWEGRPEVVIEDAALVEDADLIAIGWRGSNPISHFLLGSVAHHLVHESPCDVLVYRRGADRD